MYATQTPNLLSDALERAYSRSLLDTQYQPLQLGKAARRLGRLIGRGATATADAVFRLPFVSLGLCPEGASSLLLPRIAGERRAAQWLLGAEPFGAEDALAGQLLTALADDPLAAARARAQSLAAQPASAVRASKRLLREPGRAEVHRVLDTEAAVFFDRLQSPEAQAAFQKFFARGKK